VTGLSAKDDESSKLRRFNFAYNYQENVAFRSLQLPSGRRVVDCPVALPQLDEAYQRVGGWVVAVALVAAVVLQGWALGWAGGWAAEGCRPLGAARCCTDRTPRLQQLQPGRPLRPAITVTPRAAARLGPRCAGG
jgi:hypothetical protein